MIALATGAYWLFVPLAYGFWARVLTGPTLSPLGRLAAQVIAPRLGTPKYVAGPPKRFAQAPGRRDDDRRRGRRGSAGAETLWTSLLLDMLVVAATLESVFALCLGCKAFAVLMRARCGAAERVRALRRLMDWQLLGETYLTLVVIMDPVGVVPCSSRSRRG